MGVGARPRPGETLLDCARRNKVRIASSCGGHGRCMTCTVQITDGAVPEPSAADREAFSERRIA
jgi:ferredoxin